MSQHLLIFDAVTDDEHKTNVLDGDPQIVDKFLLAIWSVPFAEIDDRERSIVQHLLRWRRTRVRRNVESNGHGVVEKFKLLPIHDHILSKAF